MKSNLCVKFIGLICLCLILQFPLLSQTVSPPLPGFFCADLESTGGDQDLFAVRLRNFSSGGQREVFIGSGNIGQNNQPTGDREEMDVSWLTSPSINNVTIEIDVPNETLSIDVNGNILTYSSGIIDIANGLGIEDLDRFCMGIRQSDDDIDVNNLAVDGANLGNFSITSDSHWEITDICLGTATTHTISFELILSGTLPNGESAKVEFLFGGAADNNCGIPPNDRVGIGTEDDIDESAILEVRSTDKGLLPPRMTTAQRDLISNPAQGLIIYNLTLSCLQVNDGTPSIPNWNCISGM
jgi:hypothetical protein